MLLILDCIVLSTSTFCLKWLNNKLYKLLAILSKLKFRISHLKLVNKLSKPEHLMAKLITLNQNYCPINNRCKLLGRTLKLNLLKNKNCATATRIQNRHK